MMGRGRWDFMIVLNIKLPAASDARDRHPLDYKFISLLLYAVLRVGTYRKSRTEDTTVRLFIIILSLYGPIRIINSSLYI